VSHENVIRSFRTLSCLAVALGLMLSGPAVTRAQVTTGSLSGLV
jgi:hypothetical protein